MNRDGTLLEKLGGLAIASVVRPWIATLDLKITHSDIRTDPARREFQGRYIFVFWHEYISFPVTIWGHCRVAALVSLHRDGQWISRAAEHLGFRIVRGSTSRGGTRALLELQRLGQQENLTLMPDGPKGPRRRMAAGAVYLASRLGVPVVPVGFGYHRPWRLPTWDRFALPRPYSRGRCVFGPPVCIPADLDRQRLEVYRSRLERLLNQVTGQAEQWAASGRAMQGQLPMRRQRRLRACLRVRPRPATQPPICPLPKLSGDPAVHQIMQRRAS